MRRIGSVLAMLVGALIGALLLNYALFTPLALTAGLLVLTTVGYSWGRRDNAYVSP
jgi:F0F1-type ATP synthase assembly protein I